MTADRHARNARFDRLLDEGGLEQASPEDRAWLAAARAKDSDFDREVRAVLRAEAHLRDWGRHHGQGGQGSEEALVAIFAGLDAGRFDDGLVVDAAPAFADGDGSVVGLAAVTQAARPAEATSEVRGAARGIKLLRDGRLMPLLAAAAAVVLVVSGGLTAVGTMSRESSPEAVTSAPAAPAPAVSATAPSAAPAELMAPSVPEAAEARGVAGGEGGFPDYAARRSQPAAAPAPPVQVPSADGVIGAAGYGAERVRRAQEDEVAAAPPSAGRTLATGGAADDTSRSLAMAPLTSQAAPSVAPQEASPSTELMDAQGTRSEGVRPGAAAPAGRVVRYASVVAMQQAMARCVSVARDVTYEVARDTGTVRMLAAPTASSAERRCLDQVAQQTSVAPPPGVARRQRVTVTPVSATSTQ